MSMAEPFVDEELERRDPGKALALYKKAYERNMVTFGVVLATAIMTPVLAFPLVQKLSIGALQMHPAVMILILAVLSFFPPFIIHTLLKWEHMGRRWQRSGMGTRVFTAFLSFLMVMVMPYVILVVITIGVLVLAGPIVVVVKLIMGVPFEQVPEWIRNALGIVAAIISIAYMMSPSKGLTSPFPVRRLFADAGMAFVLGYRKVVGIIAGIAANVGLYRVWDSGFDSAGWGLCCMAGILIGLLLWKFDRNMDMAIMIRLGLARSAYHAGKKTQARFWLGEAAEALDSDNVDEDTAQKIHEWADQLDLSVVSMMW